MPTPTAKPRLTQYQQYALRYVAGAPGCTTRDVAKGVGRPILAVLDTLQSLAKRGIVAREQLLIDGIWTSKWTPTEDHPNA